MKRILKQPEPQELIDFVSAENDNWKPSYGNLDGKTKRATKQALMAEQGYLCCYCERRVTDDDSHIEHLIPQSVPAAGSLDYSNMLCSCQNVLRKEEPRHCGHLKDNAELAISPLDASCETRFSFTGDGHIHAADVNDALAIETIQTLGLDIRKLNGLRAGAIAPFLESDLTENEFRLFVTGYLQQDAQGAYGEFWTTIQYLFEGYAIS
jgi:uncharacterized protein (TIGR02646 family)